MNPPIKVLILTDGSQVKKWVADIIAFVSDSPDFIISGVVVNTASKKSSSSFLYRLLRLADRKFFKAKSNPFQTVSLNLDSSLVYTTLPIQKQFSDWLDEDCLSFIREKQPDVILRFGFRILRGPILGMPKFGIWSLHHGDNKINRGGPPGFWEVVQQDAISGVTLQQITEDLDGGKVLGRAFTKTDLLSFHRNQVTIFEIGIRLFEEKLKELANGQLKAEVEIFDFYSNPLFKNPDNKKTLSIIFNFGIRVVKRTFATLFHEEQWIISHSKINNSEETLYRFQNLIPPKGTSWADPFPVFYDNELWLFAEEIIGKEPGKIVCFHYLNEEKRFSSPQTIIQEPFHMSYPFVFQHEKEWFMIPETGETGNVILYKATSFPYSWEVSKTLVSGKKLFDVTPFEHLGKWYCFASERSRATTSPNDLLQLYILENGPLGAWKLHPSSPIKMDVRGGRSAGSIFQKDGKTFRPAQLGAPKYGYALQIYEILYLDDLSYKEQLVETILPHWSKDNLATHTYNQANGWQFIDSQRLVRKK
ncbi:glucosamine inositolphosphorylceramide transferase family protein [Flavobacterium psychrotolerans]|uniref:Glucosamine inositolphosphorylceramide transferase 1 N-terminal domain-containing protein n=1 Tax=Flavobacterium psychrotolerans TaxID=2169410 RepID=A0A2U1JIM1_9FLAO|nr:hypothetical protein [Flavobacterium psychrotolerans]PWA04854.1 hypothetical protein DB895_08795 [Flavobacterium psychrotolerans]